MFGFAAIVVRLVGGLGASTGLSDAMPWGIWKIINMVAGVALATGGFTLAAIVYVFNVKKYRSILKTAIVVALLGYGSSCFALFLDIGLPHTIWHPIFYWNHHSFLFEVAWCVMLYFTVTILETAPMILEKYKLTKIVNLFHKVSIPIVITGITLSSLHHTSLGSLFLVMPARLHELWFTTGLPVLFFFSAVGAGMMTVIFVSLAYSYFFNKKENMSVLTPLAKISAWILGFYLVLKIGDLVLRNVLGALFTGSFESVYFILEILFGVLIPITLVGIPAVRNKPSGLAVISIFAMVGLVLNRMNVGIIGLLRSADVGYFPTLTEFSLSFGIIAAAVLVLIYIVEHFDIVEKGEEKHPVQEEAPGVVDRLSRAWSHGVVSDRVRITLLIVITLPVAFGLFSAQAFTGAALIHTPVEAPRGADNARKVLKINGNANETFVLFNHARHQEVFEGGHSCVLCHHASLPDDNSSSCYLCHTDMFQAQSIFDHDAHQMKLGDKWSCVECHDPALPKNRKNAALCVMCHESYSSFDCKEDGATHYMADSYMDAMHGLCIECHTRTGEETGLSEMGECAFCHKEKIHSGTDAGSNEYFHILK